MTSVVAAAVLSGSPKPRHRCCRQRRRHLQRARFFVFPRVDVDLMQADWKLRVATDEDISAIEKLIPLSVRGLQATYYSAAQMEAALGSAFGVDRQLILDKTFFVVEHGGEIIGCGGWSKRKTLFGSDHQTNRDDAELDTSTDSARIRAFFIHPAWARRGIGRRILDECEQRIGAAGFKSVELAATLSGVAFYAAFNYVPTERYEVPLANGLTLPVVRMIKNFPSGG